ncbi:MAG: single-stranded DNA-binding protein [Nocardioidaceae bacterium]
MHDAMVTFSGWAGNDPVFRETSGGNVANLRVGCTPRLRRKSGDWVDGPTSWFSVSCWRSLADNVRDSVKKGDPVIVHGRLQVDVWDRDGVQSISPVVQALYVGHDLNRGRSLFTRATPPERAETDDDAEAALKELIHDPGHESPQLDSEGKPRELPRPAVA